MKCSKCGNEMDLLTAPIDIMASLIELEIPYTKCTVCGHQFKE